MTDAVGARGKALGRLGGDSFASTSNTPAPFFSSFQTPFPGKSPKFHFVATLKLDFSGSQPRRGIVCLPVCRFSIWSLWEEVSMCTFRACTFTGRDSKWASTHGNYSLFCLAIANQWENRHKLLKRFREIGAAADWRDGWFGGGLSWCASLSSYSILVILSEPQALRTSQTARQVQCGISLLMTGMALSFQRFFDGFVTMVPAMASKLVPGTKCLFSRNSRPRVLNVVSEPSPGFSRQQVYNKDLLKLH